MGLSQQALAQALYISTQAVSKWERGEAVPDLTHICRLAEILHISIDDLLDVRRSEEALIAVDGGGTKTEFLLVSADGYVQKRLLKSGCNPNDIGYSKMSSLILDGIGDILKEFQSIKSVF